MNVTEIIKMLIEYPQDRYVAEEISVISEDIRSVKEMISRLVKANPTIRSYKDEIIRIENTLNISDNIILTDLAKKEQELNLANIKLLESKIIEEESIQNLIQIKCSYLSSKKPENDYKEERDILLTRIILNRSSLYKNKEWIKAWASSSNLLIDSKWYEKFSIYIDGNKRDENYKEAINKYKESRQVDEYLQTSAKKERSILPTDNLVKEAIAVSLMIPEYINKTLVETKNNRRNMSNK